jgi:cobalt-zinc-cadmium efflux system membrane fusion protein
MQKIYFLYLILLFVVFGCEPSKEDKNASPEINKSDTLVLTDEQEKNVELSFGNIQSRQFSGEITVQGKIDLPPQNIISVNFSLGGYLKSTKLIPGMKISKGEVIAVMEDQSIVQLQQDYLLSKAKHELAKRDYERQKTLYDANAATSKTMQQVETELKIQAVNVNSLGEKLRMIGIDPNTLTAENIKGQVPIRSTINGYVSKVNVNTGKYVQPTETIFELINPDDIHVALTLFEKDIPLVKKGDRVKVSMMQDPYKFYDAEVILVNSNIDDNRTALAHCHFLNTPSNLLPGMFLEATIAVKSKIASVLPEESIIQIGAKKFIYESLGGNKFALVEVSTGLVNEGFVEMISDTSGFKKDAIVTKNAYKLLEISTMEN